MGKPSAAELIELTGLDDLNSLAIIGLSKNAGKTTSLNHLIRAWTEAKRERALALTSVGRDGEAEDLQAPNLPDKRPSVSDVSCFIEAL